ncbi:MAG: FAD-binding oxidoreductase [Pseudomonadota bacterium]
MGKLQRYPSFESYDVVIVGGAIMGSAAAWYLSHSTGFDGRILVVERDMSFEKTSTAHTTSCIRQQFSLPLNIEISQYAAQFIENLSDYMGEDADVPDLKIDSYGYLYLAADEVQADTLRNNQVIQRKTGTPTELLSPQVIAERYPFMRVDDLCLGSINTQNEGYFDGWALFDAFRKNALGSGVEYIENEVIAFGRDRLTGHITSVRLASDHDVVCGSVVNASGPRAAHVAAMAGVNVPVEPRKRFSWVFRSETPLQCKLPLTIDPTGVHVRDNGGGTYQAGGHDDADIAVDVDDFLMNPSLWQDHIWPSLANRIPQFERVRVLSEWAGHYAFNTFDQNAIVGPHPEIENYLFMNGFSGHGLQQAPAMGRGIAEWLTHGVYETLDLSPFHFDRVLSNTPYVETAVI